VQYHHEEKHYHQPMAKRARNNEEDEEESSAVANVIVPPPPLLLEKIQSDDDVSQTRLVHRTQNDQIMILLAKHEVDRNVELKKHEADRIVELKRITEDQRERQMQFWQTMRDSITDKMKSQLQVIVDNQTKLMASQIQASDVQLKNFMVPLSQHIVFGISQRLLDIRDSMVAMITSPTGAFVEALRAAVKRPAKRTNRSALHFPENQRATTDQLAFQCLTLLGALQERTAKSVRMPLGITMPGFQVTYKVWKDLRAVIGKRCLSFRSSSASTHPKLWSYFAPSGGVGTRDEAAGQRYVYLKDDARVAIAAVLKQKAPAKKERPADERIIDRLRWMVTQDLHPQTWPENSADLEPTWNEMEKIVADDNDDDDVVASSSATTLVSVN
jgi:hypothetical protein